MFVRPVNRPKTFNNQIIKMIITTMLRIFLIVASIGIRLLTAHSKTPITTRTKITPIKLILLNFNC